MTNKKIVWRLSQRPTVEEIRDLVKDKILTNEEAREILFSEETVEEKDKKSLESEIKFLRELVEKLSERRENIVTTIREVQIPYYVRQPWFQKYEVWCNADWTVKNSSTDIDMGCFGPISSGTATLTSSPTFASIQ